MSAGAAGAGLVTVQAAVGSLAGAIAGFGALGLGLGLNTASEETREDTCKNEL